MFTYNQFHWILESKSDTAVFAFGRFQGIQSGHVALLKKIVEIARTKHGLPMVFTSHTNDKKKNPLTYEQKLKYLNAVKPSGLEVVNSNAKTIYQVLEELGKLGFKHIVIVCGSDRISDFEKTKKYMTEYGIESIEVISAGERDPDADGVAGMSGTKMRQFAASNDFVSFKKGTPLSDDLAKSLFNDIRQGLGVK